MAVKNSIKAIPMTAFASSSLTASFQPVNVGGLPEACFLLKFNNFGSTFVIISFDGVNDHETINFGESSEVYGGAGSSSPNTNACIWPKGQIVYIRGTAGTGIFSLSGYFNPRGE